MQLLSPFWWLCWFLAPAFAGGHTVVHQGEHSSHANHALREFLAGGDAIHKGSRQFGHDAAGIRDTEDPTDMESSTGAAAREAARKMRSDIDDTQNKLDRLRHVDRDIANGAHRMQQVLLPEFPTNKRLALTVIPWAALNIAWLVVYFCYMYTSDRYEQPVGYHSKARIDAVFVFAHPEYAGPDRDDVVDPSDVDEDVLPHRAAEEGAEEAQLFPRTDELLRAAQGRGVLMGKVLAATATASSRVRAASGSILAHQSSLLPTLRPDQVTLGKLRVALLQDLCHYLSVLGFDFSVHKSIDGKEMYVCVSLNDEKVVSKYLSSGDARLRLRSDVVQKLNIKYPDDIPPQQLHLYQPPFMRYNEILVAQLHHMQIIPANDPKQLYQTFEGALVGGAENTRLIYRALSTHFNADAAVESGLLQAWFPAHNAVRLEDFRKPWARWGLLLDASFTQPVHAIQMYFGARVAFQIAYTGFFCKALAGLAVPALVTHFIRQILEVAGINTRFLAMRPESIAFTLTLMVWMRLTEKYWAREERFLAEYWDQAAGTSQSIVRPEFHGTLQTSEVDLNIKEKVFPGRTAFRARLLSMIACLAFCLVAMAVHFMWCFAFNEEPSIFGSLLLTITIKIFEFVFDWAALKLTRFENHKYMEDHLNSYSLKQFLFQFVNNYFAFFYLASEVIAYGEDAGGCPGNDCMYALRSNLLSTQLMLTVTQIGEVVFETVKVEVSIWWEERQLRKAKEAERQQAGGGADAPSTPPDIKVSYVERQTKYADYRLVAQVDNLLSLVISLGFICIFGHVSPLVVFLTFIVFWVSIRATALLLVHSRQRPFARRSTGVGTIGKTVKFLNLFGIVTNGILLANTGPLFRNLPTITKLSTVVLFFILVMFMWSVVDLFVPSEDHETKLLKGRHEHVSKAVARAQEQAELSSRSASTGSSLGSVLSKAISPGARSHAAQEIQKVVEKGEWAKVATFPVVEPGSEG